MPMVRSNAAKPQLPPPGSGIYPSPPPPPMTRQIFDPGEAYQFDRSHEYAVLSGTTTRVKAAHMRLCHSRMQLVQIFPRESQEMVFEAHERAFRFFGGVCRRGIYDNMRTAVSTVFVGKKRGYNRRFQEMCTHYLVDPVACTPGAGWEKGQVERQVGDVRGRLFVPSPRGRSYAEIKLDPGDTEALTPISFAETGGDDGSLTGIFVGRSHEGATGTLERDDLTAAFGAER